MSRRMGGRGRELPGGNSEFERVQVALDWSDPDEEYTPSTMTFFFFAPHSFQNIFPFICYVYYPSRFIHSVHSSYASVTSHTQSRPTHGVPYALCYVALVRIFEYELYPRVSRGCL
jgi:hypothetical protein